MILSDGKLMLAQPIEGLGTERGDLLVRVDGDVDAFIRRLAGDGFTRSGRRGRVDRASTSW